MLFYDFKARVPRSFPTCPITALTEVFHSDAARMSIHYWDDNILVQVCYGNIYGPEHMLCLYSFQLAYSFNLLTLNIAILKVFYLLSKFGLGPVADFSNAGVRFSISVEHALSWLASRAMWFGHLAWIWAMVILRWLFFPSLDAAPVED